jgi:hypothetical protein
MQKKYLDQFVQKYSLGGLVEAVKWQSSSTGLKADFCSEVRDIVGFVFTPEIRLTDGDEFTLADTAPFRSMLNVMGDEVTLKVNYANGKPFSINFEDGSTKATLVLSAPGAVNVPVLKTLPSWDLTINISKQFVETYGRAWSSMRDTDTVTFVSDGDTAQAILGFDPDGTSSNIALTLDAIKPNTLAPITIPSRNLKEVLNANKDMTKGTIAISKHRIVYVTCTTSEFSAEYYLFGTNKG